MFLPVKHVKSQNQWFTRIRHRFKIYRFVSLSLDGSWIIMFPWSILARVCRNRFIVYVGGVYSCKRRIDENVIARFRVCKGFSVQSDRGTAFANELATEFCKTLMIKQFFSTPDHPQSNGRAEKMGQVIT